MSTQEKSQISGLKGRERFSEYLVRAYHRANYNPNMQWAMAKHGNAERTWAMILGSSDGSTDDWRTISENPWEVQQVINLFGCQPLLIPVFEAHPIIQHCQAAVQQVEWGREARGVRCLPRALHGHVQHCVSSSTWRLCYFH